MKTYTETQYRLINLKHEINRLLNFSGATYEIGFTFGKGLNSCIYYYKIEGGKILHNVSKPSNKNEMIIVMEAIFESLYFTIPRNPIN